MIRIILPAILLATILFAPVNVSSESVQSAKRGDDQRLGYTAASMVSPTLDCALDGALSLQTFGGECAPQDGLEGQAYAATAVTALVAAVLGVLGLLPFLGRITSLFTMLTGLLGVGATGVSLFDVFVQNAGVVDPGVGMGAIGGLSLLTLATGFAGVRGDDQ
ncbi:MAG: hypothetical protein AAFR11_04570 [Pseudomonadota bacterium]